MALNDDIQLYEPEGLDPRVPLEGDALEHLQVHDALIQAGLEWKAKGGAGPSPSAGFDEELLARLEKETNFPVEERHFAPVIGAGEAPFFNRKGFLAATAAIFFVSFGLFWFQSYQQVHQLSAPTVQEKQEPGKEAPLSEIPNPAPLASGQQASKPAEPPAASAPGPQSRPAEAPAGDLRMSAPTSPARESEAQKRSAWSEDSTPDAETLLRDQIAMEKDPARKKDLMMQLLRFYESSGQAQKAADMRRRIQGP